MEFALYLRYGTPPTIPLCIHPTMSATRTTKLSFRFSHSSLSLSSGATCRPLGHVFNPMIRAVDRSSLPSTNDKDDNKIGRGAVGASLILACALGIIGCSSRMNPKAIAMPPPRSAMAHPVADPTVSMPALRDLKSFLQVIECLAPGKEPKKSKVPPFSLSERPSRSEVDKFKMVLLKKIKSGKADEAIKQLQQEIKKKDPEPAFNLEMALVEIYIILGKYKEALECKRLNDVVSQLEKRPTLYKAIIYTMLDKEKEAKKYWKEFTDAVVKGRFDPGNIGK